MTTISVRLSRREKNALKKCGKISEVVREAISLYFNSKQSERAIRKLRELQGIQKAGTTSREEVLLISEDRRR